jgi:D-tyrosyl-tRNA(Tyr) deacylase
MRVLLQRVTSAAVTADGSVVGCIERGLVLLTGIGPADTSAIVERMAEKIANLRIFNDEEGKFNRSLLDVAGGVLVVSQFTLFADARKGRRPSFTDAARPELAAPLCDHFAAAFGALRIAPVATGVFGASMQVQIHNDGPVTLWLDSAELGFTGAP